MAPAEEHEQVISDIYLAGAGIQSWSVPLHRLARLTGSRNSTIAAASLRSSPAQPVFLYDDGELDRETVADYSRFMQESGCLRWEYAAPIYHQGGSSFFRDHDFIEERRMSKHPYYEDVLRAAGLKYSAVQLLPARVDVGIVVTLQRSGAQGAVEQTEAEILRRMALHIDKALRIQSYLAQTPRGSQSFPLPDNAAVLGADGSVMSSSEPLELQLLQPGLFKLRNNRLIGATVALQKRVSAALQAARAASVNHIDLKRRGLRLTFIPVVPDTGLFLPAPLVAMIAEPLEQVAQGPVALATRHFGLTPSEAHILELLSQGHAIRMIAEMRSVSIWTVKTQLKSIFQKVGARSQTELLAQLNAMT